MPSGSSIHISPGCPRRRHARSRGSRGSRGRAAPFALVGGAVNITPDAVLAALRCEHDSSNGANPYVDGDASFWAT
jgi:hypothetical protein